MEFKIKKGFDGKSYVVFQNGYNLFQWTQQYPEDRELKVYCFGGIENAFLAEDFFKARVPVMRASANGQGTMDKERKE
jgi:hypothetical protein